MQKSPLVDKASEDAGADGSMKVVARLATVLKTVGQFAARGATFTDVGREAGLGKSTTHRLLAALVEAGLVYQDVESKRYRLGSAIALLGANAVAQAYTSACQRALEDIARVSGDTVFSSVIEGSGAVCIGRVLGGYPVRTLVLDVGDRRPLGVGAGSLALLAALDDAAIERILERNLKWLADYPNYSVESIRDQVRATRANGYAFMPGQIVSGICAIGVAVVDRDGRPLCALSISAIADRMGDDRLPVLADLLRVHAQEVGSLILQQQS
ncbi:IclR family transcriptional regulator [Bordetella genomosp. 13]|uniref:IclR family transcriptional regulator n=1 Tax=Bordetella genomosp. 13 TaxID=463040 RepID=UPI0011A7E4C4|nr:IclR family transcriptional regulator [Bordetella genomosp. 13]